MTNKFLFNSIILSTIFSCSPQQSYPAENEDEPDFSADPNNFDYFEKNFDTLINFTQKSISRSSNIGPKQVKKCIKYILRYKDLRNFYERSKSEQFLSERFKILIFTLASYHKEILDREVSKFERGNPGTECDLKEIVDEIYTSKISEMEKVEDKEDSTGKILRTSSEIIDLLREFISNNLKNLMAKRADVAFFYATSLIYDLKLSEILLQKDFFREQVNYDKGNNTEILKNLFAQELSRRNHLYFSEEDCKSEKKSQYEILVDEFKFFFNKSFPYIDYDREIPPYLEKQRETVERNVRECVKEFFKTNYQRYKIKFSECTLNLLDQYLENFSQNTSQDEKEDFAEIFVLYLLNFRSDRLQRSEYVFNDMGHTMLRYEGFEPKNQKYFNDVIDRITDFISNNYNEMDKKLFEETTGKKIKDGNKKIIEELKQQLDLAKRI